MSQPLAELEAIIEAKLDGPDFLEVGRALETIRTKELYRPIPSFEKYVRQRFQRTRIWAYELISAVEVADDVLTKVNIKPDNARDVRPLARLPREVRLPVILEAKQVADKRGERLGPEHWKPAAKRWRDAHPGPSSRQSFFDLLGEAERIHDWLLARYERWPEAYSSEFFGVVRRQVDALEVLHVEGREGQGGTESGSNGAASGSFAPL